MSAASESDQREVGEEEGGRRESSWDQQMILNRTAATRRAEESAPWFDHWFSGVNCKRCRPVSGGWKASEGGEGGTDRRLWLGQHPPGDVLLGAKVGLGALETRGHGAHTR